MTTPPLERSLRPGGYLSHHGEIYQITAVHPDGLALTVVNQATQEAVNLHLVTLLTTQPETLGSLPHWPPCTKRWSSLHCRQDSLTRTRCPHLC